MGIFTSRWFPLDPVDEEGECIHEVMMVLGVLGLAGQLSPVWVDSRLPTGAGKRIEESGNPCLDGLSCPFQILEFGIMSSFPLPFKYPCHVMPMSSLVLLAEEMWERLSRVWGSTCSPGSRSFPTLLLFLCRSLGPSGPWGLLCVHLYHCWAFHFLPLLLGARLCM